MVPTTQWHILDTLKARDEDARGAALGDIVSIYGYISNADRAKRTQKRRPAGGFVSLDGLREEFGSALEPRTSETRDGEELVVEAA